MKRTEKYLSLLLLTLVAAPVIAEEEAMAEHDEVVRAGAPVTMGILREHIKAVTGSGFNGQTMTNVALSNDVTELDGEVTTLGSAFATLATVVGTYASIVPSATVTSTAAISWSAPAPITPAGFVTVSTSTITLVLPGTYVVTVRGTLTSDSSASVLSIATTGTAAAASTALPNTTGTINTSVGFSLTQIVTATANQTLIYTPTMTNSGTVPTLQLIITRLA